ncbi:MAG: glycosyl transferase family 9 [Chlorobi bacterium]|nr:glycosyl transferase family 9 [Chlorobiota bacterium]
MIEPESPNATISTKSLLIIQSGFLGDAVLASGMLRAIAASGADLRVGLVVRAEFGDLFAGHPALAALHRFDKKRKGGTRELADAIRARGYDTALLPHRSLRSAWAIWRAGIRRRVGFRQSEAPFLLTDRVEYDITSHETDRNAMLLQRIGIGSRRASAAPWLVPAAAAVVSVKDRMGDAMPFIAVAPGSVWGTKRWSPSGFAAVIAGLRDRGMRAVLIGSGGERDLCLAIAREAGLDERDVLAGELGLPELLATIALAERVISNDSAPIHLAESVGTPVTALFGPTVPEFGFAPRGAGSVVLGMEGLPCRPCGIHGGDRCPIGTHECMTSIDAEVVLAASLVERR